MKAPTKKITTPAAKAVVEIKDWITGEDAEYIDDALMSAVDVKPDQRGSANFRKMNVASAITEQAHREIEKFIVSMNEKTDNVLKDILGLPEEDYQFIQDEIKKLRKKKVLGAGDTPVKP